MKITYNRRTAYLTLPQHLRCSSPTEGSVEQRILSLLNTRRFGDELTDGEVLFIKTNSDEYRYGEFNENQDTCWDRYGRYIEVNDKILMDGKVYQVSRNLTCDKTILRNNKEERLNDMCCDKILCNETGEVIEPPTGMKD